MTRYAIQNKTTKRWWIGTPDGWSIDQAEARTFEFMSDALTTAYSFCQADPLTYDAVPILRADVAPANEQIVAAATADWLRSAS